MPDFCHLLVLVICSLVFFIFGAYVAGGIMFTSVNLTDEPASWVSALSTAFAAFGTFFTLVFLIYQHFQLRKSQQEETLRREDHERKQQAMFTFQKLQMHKREFNNLLKEIENTFPIKFYEQTHLYKKLFPKNSLKSPTIELLSHDTEMKNSYIELQDLIEEINSPARSDNPEHIDLDLAKRFITISDDLRHHLQINLPNRNYFGDVTCGTHNEAYVITNIFSSLQSTSTYGKVLQKLLDFAGINLTSVIGDSGFYNRPLYTLAPAHEAHGGWDVNLGEISNAFSNICYVMRTINKWCVEPKLQDALYDAEAKFMDELNSRTEEEAANTLKDIAHNLEQALISSSDPSIKNREKCIDKLQEAQNELRTRICILGSFS